jgi:hypothetical protein
MHSPLSTCHCAKCQADRENSCENPQKCMMEALMRLKRMTQKFNPLSNPESDNLMLTHRWKTANAAAQLRDNKIIFDPSITCKTNLSDCFHIFMNGEAFTTTTAERQPPARGISLDNESLTTYTDGSCTHNREENALCGACQGSEQAWCSMEPSL